MTTKKDEHEMPDTRVDGLPKPDQQSELPRQATSQSDLRITVLSDALTRFLEAAAYCGHDRLPKGVRTHGYRAGQVLYERSLPTFSRQCAECRDRWTLLADTYALGLRDGLNQAQQQDLAHTATVQREKA